MSSILVLLVSLDNMESKIVFVFLQLFFLQNILAQCIRPGFSPAPPALLTPPAPVVAPAALVTAAPGTFSCQLAVQQPELPSPSFSIFADNLVVDGLVSVSGSMPFLGTVTINGKLPAAGQGRVLYGCGNGEIDIVEEVVTPGISEAIAIGPVAPKWANGPGLRL